MRVYYLKGAHRHGAGALLVEILGCTKADFSEWLTVVEKVLDDLRAAELRLMRGQRSYD